jgi:hypothetical protein
MLLTNLLKSKRRSRIKRSILWNERRMTLTIRRKMMRKKLPGCTYLSSKRSMRKTKEIRKSRKGKRKTKEDARRRLTWRMQPDTFRGSGSGSRRLESSLPRKRRRAEREAKRRRSDDL